ncbi:hypothetical protein [Actinocrispum wychmicini]|uniref:AbiJ-NTD3 domain-containing protein n=1 Tax=Actinocrispum wychmicini TaxID=1213861 RepID=A0A4R2JDS6_9PSEU|nr:hypothetical protein [Actinocrispum wychmicini]TCO54359.1 hypothetical protein EV192_109340 [Actinocrispum wychmicini]
MSQRLSADRLRHEIAVLIADRVKAYDVDKVCTSLGLDAAKEDADPFRSKYAYVKSRLLGHSMDQLRSIAARAADEYGDEELEALLVGSGATGVDGELKNIIFASNGPKPRIVMRDAINNVIEIVENAEYCLVYDRTLSPQGLEWRDLVEWWATAPGMTNALPEDIGRGLYKRLFESLASEPERLLFRAYCKRVVIEVDGKQHYADSESVASPRLYAEMVSEDRRLRLAGNEVYRFGGYELQGERGERLLDEFFESLLGGR